MTRLHNRWIRSTWMSVFLLVAAGSAPAQSVTSPPPLCEVRLVVHLTPDVPDSTDSGFLSSLVTDPSFAIVWREQRGTDPVVDLRGPGPKPRCDRVLDSIRRDGRVLSLDVERQSS